MFSTSLRDVLIDKKKSPRREQGRTWPNSVKFQQVWCLFTFCIVPILKYTSINNFTAYYKNFIILLCFDFDKIFVKIKINQKPGAGSGAAAKTPPHDFGRPRQGLRTVGHLQELSAVEFFTIIII